MSGQVLMAAQTIVRPRIAQALALLVALVALAVAASTASATITWSAPRAVDTSGGQSLLHVQCPSSVACVAIDDNGRATDFDPATAKTSAPVEIAAGEVPM